MQDLKGLVLDAAMISGKVFSPQTRRPPQDTKPYRSLVPRLLWIGSDQLGETRTRHKKKEEQKEAGAPREKEEGSEAERRGRRGGSGRGEPGKRGPRE